MFERYSYRYHQWDETQQVDPYTADDVMDALADKLMEDGNPERALQDLYERGDRGSLDHRLPGLRDLLDRLRRQRRQDQQRHNLNGMMDDLAQRIDDVVSTEQSALDRQISGGMPSKSPLDGDSMPATESEALRNMMRGRAQRKKEELDALPPDVPGRFKALSDYDFLDSEARDKFQELQQMLQQHVLQSYFQGMQQAIQGMTPEDLARSREMVRDLNEMLEDRMQGREPKFEQFMDKYGDMFPGVTTLDELLEQLAARMGAMNSLMESMSPEMRQQLQEMMDQAIGDDRLRVDMMRLAGNLAQVMPDAMMGQEYSFNGDEPLSLLEAMAMMERLHGLDALEDSIMGAQTGDGIESIDPQAVRDLLGPEEAAHLERLQELNKTLEEAGYVRRQGDRLELTPHALRRLGQKALRDVFSNLKRDGFGRHESDSRGTGGERIDDTKPYEFGDPFFVDIRGTMMNALTRSGTGTPVRIAPDDFEVYRTELMTDAATVLMLDKSRSMFLNGCFLAAKKVAMALDSLIRGQYPRDKFYIVEFSYLAQQIEPSDLPRETWDEYTYGTNFQHGLMLARQLLAQSHAHNKQILVVTDGEPTAHLEDGIPEFNYPTTHRCLVETLREVGHVTRENIVINTFMLETSPLLTRFVEQMTSINKGRAFYSSPDQLSDYILVDYVRNKRTKRS